LHVTSQSHLEQLSSLVRSTNFADAAKSSQDAALIGPPTLEFATYYRIPTARKRHDNRQGTIDQDPEFKEFLESLTNPIAKPAAPDTEARKEEKVTTTPLIEALREKKANKDKPPSKGSAKHGRAEAKEDTADKDRKILGKGKEAATASPEKNRKPGKAERAAKEAVKVLNKEASSSKDVHAAATLEKAAPASPGSAPERKRGNASIAKSMLQRDLGIGPAASRRRGTKRELTPAAADAAGAANNAEDGASGKEKGKEAAVVAQPQASAGEKAGPLSPKKEQIRPSRSERRAIKASTLVDQTNTKNAMADPKAQIKTPAAHAHTILKKPQATTSPAPPKGPAASRAPPTEPAAARGSAGQPQANAAKIDTGSSRPAPAGPTVSTSAVTSRQAFLKHANASQGITEALIEEALKAFGAIDKVEIDKRKGFAYVDFGDPEGLAKAIAASPVKVAQGAVQVLERKEKVVRPPPGPRHHPAPHLPPMGPARGRGGFAPRGRGRGGARGGGHVAPSADGPPAAASPSPSAATPASEITT
jgi:regulator of nonsense transcripts 3